MKKKLSLLLCAALTATTLAGCGQAQSSPAGTDAGTEASAAGTAGSKEGEKILTYAVMEEPETLDPTLNNYSTSSTFLQNMFCGLFQLEADGIAGTDYLRDEGGASTVFNMGVNGMFATYFVLAVGGELNLSLIHI